MKRHVISRREIVFAVVVSIAAVLGALRLTSGSPVYSVAQVRYGLLSDPHAWIGRTVQIRGLDIYPGGQTAFIVDPGNDPYKAGLPVRNGSWQTPTFPHSFIWWLGSNVSFLRGIDGGRDEVYTITLVRPLRKGCTYCSVGHG